MALTVEDMAVFCKRKGFVYQNSEIYGGNAGFWDFGSYGAELKNNIKHELWKAFVHQRDDIVGIDGSIITHPKVWEASGHVTSFTDAVLECSKCKHKTRADHLIEDKLKISVEGITAENIDKLVEQNKLRCGKCGSEFNKAKTFNLMFRTNVGPVADNVSYLRPETAQVIFTNFKLVQENNRMKLPFGIAQLGKAFRNEISPRDFLFRSREFEQFEIEFFVHPDRTKECRFYNSVKNFKLNVLTGELQEKDGKHREMAVEQLVNEKLMTEWHAYWLVQFYKFFLSLGVRKENLRLREHLKKELAHYANACFDIEYQFPFGWREIHGSADRTQFDLKQHINTSKVDLSLFDEDTKQRIIPYVAAEPSQGIERAMLVFLFEAYDDDKKRGNIVLRLHPKLAPVKAAVFPLIKDSRLVKLAKSVFNELRTEFNCFYDEKGSIGRRYARSDEIGTPYCITIDFDSIKKKSVTIRNRDDTKQIRVKVKDLRDALVKLINCEAKFKGIK